MYNVYTYTGEQTLLMCTCSHTRAHAVSRTRTLIHELVHGVFNFVIVQYPSIAMYIDDCYTYRRTSTCLAASSILRLPVPIRLCMCLSLPVYISTNLPCAASSTLRLPVARSIHRTVILRTFQEELPPLPSCRYRVTRSCLFIENSGNLFQVLFRFVQCL